MTQTMTLNHDSPRTRNPLGFLDITPSIPSFMEHSFGACSILRRNSNELAYHEQWVPIRTHRASYEEGASPLEVDMYLAGNGTDFLDVPEPIDAPSADEWDEMCAMDDGDPHYIPEEELETLIA